MNTRNTHNSQPGALNAFSFLPAYEGNPPRSDTPLVCTVAPANPSSSLLIPMPNTVLQNQPSPTFLAGVTKAVKQELWAEQAGSLPASTSLASVSMVSISGGVPAQPTSLSQLDSQALSLAASGIGLSSLPPATATAPAPGGPNFFVPTLVSTFSTPGFLPSYIHLQQVLSMQLSHLALGGAMSLAQVPALHQPLMVGPGFSPVSAKLASQIVAGKFIEVAFREHCPSRA